MRGAVRSFTLDQKQVYKWVEHHILTQMWDFYLTLPTQQYQDLQHKEYFTLLTNNSGSSVGSWGESKWSSTLNQEQSYKWIRHHILTQNLNTLILWSSHLYIITQHSFFSSSKHFF